MLFRFNRLKYFNVFIHENDVICFGTGEIRFFAASPRRRKRRKCQKVTDPMTKRAYQVRNKMLTKI